MPRRRTPVAAAPAAKAEWKPDEKKVAKQTEIVEALKAAIAAIPDPDPAKIKGGLKRRLTVAERKLTELTTEPDNRRRATLVPERETYNPRTGQYVRPNYFDVVYEPKPDGTCEITELLIVIPYAGNYSGIRSHQTGKLLGGAFPAICNDWNAKVKVLPEAIEKGEVKVTFQYASSVTGTARRTR